MVGVMETVVNQAATATATTNEAFEAEDHVDPMQEVMDDVRGSIISLLTTFPYISSGMIQVGIGPACPPKLWRPVLERMVEDKTVVQRNVQVTTPKGRNITRTVYHLFSMPYPPVALGDVDEPHGK